MPALKNLKIDPLLLRPTVMEVDLDALAWNFRQFQALAAPSQVMAVVKANAYGHGLVVCAEHLVKVGATYLAVAFVEEGIELREAGINVPILIFGGISESQIELYLENDLDITAASVLKLKMINEVAEKLQKRARVHLEVDTGMERIGVQHDTANSLFSAALQASHCDIIAVYSHLATAGSDWEFTRLQLERFLECIRFFEDHSLPTPALHIAATAAAIEMPESRLDFIRPGLGLYGIYAAAEERSLIELKPVMSLKSKVVFFKVVRKGCGVSYDLTWKAPEDTRVVTVPIGYGDGFFRRLSNCGQVLIRGSRYPIVGLVCMDQMMINIGPNGEAFNGDEVVLIGKQGNQEITVEEVANLVGTNTYDILVSTNLRVPRLYFHTEA